MEDFMGYFTNEVVNTERTLIYRFIYLLFTPLWVVSCIMRGIAYPIMLALEWVPVIPTIPLMIVSEILYKLQLINR